MKKSFMTRALAMGLSLAMAFSLSAATNVSVASAAATPAMASKQFAVRVGGASKSYKASTATQKSFRITKATVGNTDKATVSVNSSRKSLKVTPGTVTGTTVVTVTFKNIKTAKSTAKKYRCVVKAAIEQEPEKPVEEVKATKITEATASTAKTVTVKFDGVVDTTTTPAIKLTRGTTDITVTSAFSSDKKELVLTASTALAAGNYTVTVGSFAPVSFNVVKQTPTTLKINNTTVANHNGARIYFQVLDQYGDAMPNYTAKKLSVTAYNTTKGHSVNPGNLNSSDDYFTVQTGTQDTTAAGKINAIDDVISIVAFLKDAPAVSCTTSLKIVRVYTETLEFGDIVLDSDKRVTVGNKYVLKYTAKDNEGNDVVFEKNDIVTSPSSIYTDSNVTIGDYTFISSNPSAVSMKSLDIDSKKVLSFKAGSRGTAVITAVNNNTGVNSTITIEVNDEPKLAALDIADASVAKNATTNTRFNAAVVAYDQFGEVIDAQNLKNRSITTGTGGDFNSVNTNSLGAPIEIEKFSADGKYIVYHVTTNLSSRFEGNAKFTFISLTIGPNGAITSTSNVEIGDTAEPSALDIVKDPVTSIISGDSIKVQFSVKDQYQNKMEVSSLGSIQTSATGDYYIDLTDSSDYFSVQYTTGKNATPSAIAGQDKVYELPIKVNYIGNAADAVSKTGTFTMALKDGNKVIDSKTFTVKVGKLITDYEVTTNSDVYTSGDKILTTIKAMSGTQLNTLANGDVKLSYVVTQGAVTKTGYETVTFKDGVASLELKAEKSCTNGTILVRNTDTGVYGTYSNGDDNTYEVLPGSVGKFVVNANNKLEFADNGENTGVDMGTGVDTGSYAVFKLKNITTGKDISISAVTAGALTVAMTNNQTASVVINKTTREVVSMGGVTYDLSTGLQVAGVKASNVNDQDLLELTITINGVTWTSYVRCDYSADIDSGNNYVTFTK